MHDDQFRILLEHLQYSWSGYRKVRKGVKKRIQRHMNQLNCRNMTDYIKLLDFEPVTRHQCELQMTVSISRFFRDRRLWDLLKRSWLPNLIIKNSRVLKVWSAGCACGEEAYSFKIIWEQLGQAFHLLPKLELLATDIYPHHLERARSGIYSRSSLKEVSSDLLEIYFESHRGGRQCLIKNYLKDGIRWKLHHLSTDPPDKNFDIIFLRNNVLTYYRREAREKVLNNILDSLLPGGLFIIGCHETLPYQTPLLRPMAELSYVFTRVS